MNVFIVYAHPSQLSFNAALKDTALHYFNNNKIAVVVSDLYAMNFKANADWKDFTFHEDMPHQYSIAQKKAFLENRFTQDIIEEQKKISWSDLIILQFPLWWFSAPAILKGWFDRVLSAGFAYDKNQWFDTSPLVGKEALIVTTTQAPSASYTNEGLNGDIDEILYPLYHSLHFVGITVIQPFVAYEVMTEDEKYRKKCLMDYDNYLKHLNQAKRFPITMKKIL